MKKISFEELFNSNLPYIYIIGYGSFLNTKTIGNGSGEFQPVLINDYKRVYNNAYSKKECENEMETFSHFSKLVGEDFSNRRNILKFERNSGVLNLVRTKDSFVNGVLFKVNREEFQQYIKNTPKHYLQEVNYHFLTPTGKVSKKTTKEKAFVIITDEEYAIPPYYLYDKVCRNGAYEQGKLFGETYDETTFYEDELSYNHIIKTYFKPGHPIVIADFYHTLLKTDVNKSEIVALKGKKGVVIGHKEQTLVDVLTEDGKRFSFDFGDLC